MWTVTITNQDGSSGHHKHCTPQMVANLAANAYNLGDLVVTMTLVREL